MALRPISRLDDFTFPPDAWDVSGWTVRTAVDDEKVGRVDDMLLGRDGELRYLDVDLGFLKKHVLVPLTHSHADRESKTVWIEGVPKARLEEAPEYALDPETLTEGYERRLVDYYDGTHPGRVEDRAPHADPRPSTTRATPSELRRMADLEDEYQVAGDDPRGWKVVTGDGATVGRVLELIVEPGDMKARYLDVAVDEKELELEPVDRHVLLPTEQVRLDRSSRKVVISGLLATDFGEYPQYGGLPLDDDQTHRIHAYFDRSDRDVVEPAERHEPNHRSADSGRPGGTGTFYRTPAAREARREERGIES
jgi:ribosomal 30S subunit maturation factor RimM